MQAIACERGGECLSTEYRHFSEPLRWRCAKGHVWDTKPGGIVNNGSWCRRCAGKEKHTLEEVRKLGRERGGECLSIEYVNLSTPLRWRCAEGHEWPAAFGNVRTGSWCPKCAVRNPLSIEEMRSIANARGGECLSDAYMNPRVKLRWRCADGHEWEASGFRVAREGHWCRICSGRLDDGLERMRAVAKERGGECLAERYEGIDTKVTWRCVEGHSWSATFHNVETNGSWCPICAEESRNRLAPFRGAGWRHGGELLSLDVSDASQVARWRCAEGHEFRMKIARVLAGSWCRRCDGDAIASGSIAARIRAWCRTRKDEFTTADLLSAFPGQKQTTASATLGRMVRQGDTIEPAGSRGRFRLREDARP